MKNKFSLVLKEQEFKDLSRLAVIDFLQEKKRRRITKVMMQHAVDLTIQSQKTLPELCVDSDFRAYFAEVLKQCPHLFFYLRTQTPVARAIFYSQIDPIALARKNGRFSIVIDPAVLRQKSQEFIEPLRRFAVGYMGGTELLFSQVMRVFMEEITGQNDPLE